MRGEPVSCEYQDIRGGVREVQQEDRMTLDP